MSYTTLNNYNISQCILSNTKFITPTDDIYKLSLANMTVYPLHCTSKPHCTNEIRKCPCSQTENNTSKHLN